MSHPLSLTRRALARGFLATSLLPASACGRTQAEQDSAPTPVRSTGMEPSLLAEAAQAAEALPQLRAMIVVREGRTLFERVFRGPGLEVPANIKSASKTVLSALAGAAIARGVLEGLAQPIGPILGRRIPAAADPRVRSITVEHLVTMAAGLESTSGANYGRWVGSSDWLAFALTRPFVAEPGSRMIYSTGTSHILSAVLTAASGRSTLELAREWLGAPLGVTIPPWPRGPEGVYFGGNDMLLSPRAMVRFGEMYRNGGLHQGSRVLPSAWVADSWRSRGGRSPYTGYTYGLGWWLRRAGPHPVNFAWGYGGQMIYVIPSLALTVVMMSDPTARSATGHVQQLHALLDRLIVPAAERGASGPT